MTISNEAENNFVMEYAKETGRAGYVALGLHDLNTEGAWEWITGEEVAYTNWNSGEPNNGLGGGQQDRL